jgi:hypothetical protein
MKYIKKFGDFLLENSTLADPVVKPSRPDVKPDIGQKPGSPSPIRRDRTSPVPAPAKAMKKATAEDVAERFIELIIKSDDDIKKYVELK